MKTNIRHLTFTAFWFIACPLVVMAAEESPTLNQAQVLIFMGNHLHNVSAGQTITYSFTSRAKDQKEIKDNVRMKVTGIAEDGGRDLEFEFLSDERRLPFPSARGYKGNPITIQFLERDVRDMALAAGGSSSYFRNRVRNAFVNPQIRDIQVPYQDASVSATEVIVTPFAQDPRAGEELTEIHNKNYRFIFSADIPGGLYMIHTTVPGETGPKLEEKLKFSSADATNST